MHLVRMAQGGHAARLGADPEAVPKPRLREGRPARFRWAGALTRVSAKAREVGKMGTEPKRLRLAQLLAEAVSVCCPHCGEPQPNKDGSEMWTREDFTEQSIGVRKCSSCDARILIAP